MIDAARVREWFPQLRQGLVYLDNAASTLKPVQVAEAMFEFLTSNYSNVHRGSYRWAVEATERYERARERVAGFIGASPREVVFTSGASSGIWKALMLSYVNGIIRNGCRVIVPLDAHHSLILAAARVARLARARLTLLPLTGEGTPDWGMIDDLLPEACLLAVGHVSNVTGAIAPLDWISRRARKHGVVLVVDAAQSAPHMPLDASLADMLAFSGHKMLGPTGVGVLYINKRLADRLEPDQPGGGTVASVKLIGGDLRPEWEEPPWRFEAGTPPIAEAVGLAKAVELLYSLGMENVMEHDLRLAKAIVEGLEGIEGARILGPSEGRLGIVSFTINGIAPDLAAHLLARRGVAVRAGMHCAQPLHEALGYSMGSVRASTYIYNTMGDVEELLDALKSIV